MAAHAADLVDFDFDNVEGGWTMVAGDGAVAIPARQRDTQRAPLRVQEVVQVTVVPRSHDLQALTHWFMSRGL